MFEFHLGNGRYTFFFFFTILITTIIVIIAINAIEMSFQGRIQKDISEVNGAKPGWKLLYVTINFAFIGPNTIALSFVKNEPRFQVVS
jgi:hypothetical protein